MIWESLFTYETETSKLENRGHRSSLPGAHAVDVAAATRLRGAPLLSAPTPSSAALLRLPDAVTARSTSSDRLLSARSLFPLLWAQCKIASPHGEETLATGGGRAGVASYHPLSKSFNGAARRSPQAAAQRVAARYAKRERTTKDFGIDLFNSDERPTLRPEALLSMSLCLLVQRSSGCAQLSMCGSCQRC